MSAHSPASFPASFGVDACGGHPVAVSAKSAASALLGLMDRPPSGAAVASDGPESLVSEFLRLRNAGDSLLVGFSLPLVGDGQQPRARNRVDCPRRPDPRRWSSQLCLPQ